MNYTGSFSGTLIGKPHSDLNYTAMQSVNLLVKQNEQILHQSTVKNIHHKIGKQFDIEFALSNTKDPIVLCIDNSAQDDQFNRDISIELTQLKFDNLFTCKHLLHKGTLKNTEGKIIDCGNSLWCTGQLTYSFNLPMISNANLIPADVMMIITPSPGLII